MNLRILQGDKAVWAIFIVLCAISLVEVSSAGSFFVPNEGGFTKLFLQQAAFILTSIFMAWTLHQIPCRIYKIVPLLGYIIVALMLGYALAFGQNLNNGARWVSFFGLFTFQPSELSKGVLVLTVALVIASNLRQGKLTAKGFYASIIFTLIYCSLIVTQNFSTAAILFLAISLLLFVYHPPLKPALKVYGALLALSVFFVFTISLLPKDPNASIYKNPIMQRVTTWRARLSSEKAFIMTPNPKDFEITDRNRQVVHARIALARAHGTGVLPGRSVQRDYLSAAYSDFIFAIIAEEMGIAGCVLVVLLYIWLFIRCGRIASQCLNTFPAALAMGFGLLLVTQAIVNMLVAVGLGPVTGQPLPLISKGGTSTIITGAYIGIILSASRSAKRVKHSPQELVAEEPTAAIAAEHAKA